LSGELIIISFTVMHNFSEQPPVTEFIPDRFRSEVNSFPRKLWFSNNFDDKSLGYLQFYTRYNIPGDMSLNLRGYLSLSWLHS